MTVPIKTWIFDTFRAPGAQSSAAVVHQNVVFQIKQFLCGAVPANATGAWTVQGSSDGSTAGATDLWLSATNVVQVLNTGTAHSWIVLRSPAGMLPNSAFIEILINCHAANSAGNLSKVIQLVIANDSHPFVIVTTPATAPVAPTNAVTLASKQIIDASSTLPHHMNFWRSTEGDFILCIDRDTTTINQFNWWNLVGRNGESTDNYPIWIGAEFNAAGCPTISGMQTAGNGAAWNVDGTVASVLPAISKLGSTTLATVGVPATGSFISSKHPVQQIDLWRATSPKGSYCGRVPDIRWSYSNGPNLTLEGGSDNFRDLIFGELTLFLPSTTAAPTF